MHPDRLNRRQYIYDDDDDIYVHCDYYGNCYTSRWNSWGRWAVVTGLIIMFFLLFFLCTCIHARRRRRAGLPPLRGTNWMIPRGNNNNQPQYNDPSTYSQHQNQQPYYPPPPAGYYGNPPQYTPNTQYTGTTNGSHQPYYPPPPGPPPPPQSYEMTQPTGTPPPVTNHPTHMEGAAQQIHQQSTGGSYIQSNNPYAPSLDAPPPAHTHDTPKKN